jgi:FlaA1/EpsC-like NDP-sugar epimerase
MTYLLKNTPRILVLAGDCFVCLCAIVLAYLLRFNFHIPALDYRYMPFVIACVMGVKTVAFVAGRTYYSLVRYTNLNDAFRLVGVLFLCSLIYVLANLITYKSSHIFYLPFSIIIIDFLACSFALVSARVFIKYLYIELKNPRREKTNVMIVGAGETGLMSKKALERDAGTKYRMVAFLDSDSSMHSRKIEGVKVYDLGNLEKLLVRKKVRQVILALPEITPALKKEIADTCLYHEVRILTVPPIQSWINGELSFKQIRKIRIDELLERDPIVLDKGIISERILNKRVLVTGAAGSIGSELVRQLIPFKPAQLILLDMAESPLFEMEMELKERLLSFPAEIVVGDIRSQARMEQVFRHFSPQVVFHAAAYKHVPMMEENPSEAVLTNVLGTKILADLSHQYSVETFVFISTDKAVNPTNVMGATKRASEMYIQSLNARSTTQYITTRFGNVIGSSGSVIPRFRKQIESGGPVTITHQAITRFFMTIPEACQLVLEAASMGKGGEIFVFDMGKPVKILDLAKKMIRLSGLTLGKDIEIVETGLRPGEKLYEELLSDSENTLPTHHSQILIAKVAPNDFDAVSQSVEHLVSLFDSQDNYAIVARLKTLVPEFVSNNSIYSALDKNNQESF